MPEYPPPYGQRNRLHQRPHGEERVYAESDKSSGKQEWNVKFEGSLPKLLFVATNGEIIELDTGDIPTDDRSLALLQGLIALVTGKLQEKWLHGG